ncbi:MAG TPA: endonuclease/exonuclease/phosphatase family protein [Acidimicrobiales bacterium]|nr:endonuclease/exonuclease/phosphatase family protein [Acidimicrobiales bacterium]
MRVATFNLHAGVDGWGRPTRVLEVIKELDADVLILPELWRGDDGPDFYEDLRSSLHLEGDFAALARAERVTSGQGGSTWQPRLAHLVGERGLYFAGHRSLTKAQLANRARHHRVEHGTWGLGLLTRLEIEDVRAISLGRLARERVQRALLVARLKENDRSFYVLAIHGAHLSHGSHRQYQRVSEIVETLDPSLPILIGGDFNSWRPLLRLLLPGWHTLAAGRTWPAARPHSQIDHLLGRGPWKTTKNFTRDGGSDHLALVADLELL